MVDDKSLRSQDETDEALVMDSEFWITLGPSSIGHLPALIGLGVNGIRFTFSFGTPELQIERALQVAEAARSVDQRCLKIADLPGEKYRLGRFRGSEVVRFQGGSNAVLTVSLEENPTATRKLPVPQGSFFDWLSAGDVITVGDGAALLRVLNLWSDAAEVEFLEDAVVEQVRGLTIQSARFHPKPLSEIDRNALGPIRDSGAFDAVAVSFVASPRIVEEVRKTTGLPVISKIETAAGLEKLPSIAGASDYVMAARGDLALTLPWVELPAAVSKIAEESRAVGTPWIVATQVAEGVEKFAIPTRAEICDLAHWFDEGAAGVMLSYETVFGSQPIRAVRAVSALVARWRQSN
jgi:pyruvate kinase